MAFPQVFAKLFTTDAELIAFTAKALRIYCRVLFVFGIQIACQMTFVSIGNGALFYYCGNFAEIYIADSTDLYIATFYGKQDQCGIYGRTGSGCHCGKLYVTSVFGAV